MSEFKIHDHMRANQITFRSADDAWLAFPVLRKDFETVESFREEFERERSELRKSQLKGVSNTWFECMADDLTRWIGTISLKGSSKSAKSETSLWPSETSL
jgi:hypothetical protein